MAWAVVGDMASFSPMVNHFGSDEWTFVTWNYRGLFASDQPKRQRVYIFHVYTLDCVLLCILSCLIEIHLVTSLHFRLFTESF